MSTPDALYEEANRLEIQASQKDDWAAELRSQAALLPHGVNAAAGWIEPSVWEGRAAGQAGEAITQGGNTVHGAADDLEIVARRLSEQADDLRAAVAKLRRQAGMLQAASGVQP
ncbi:MAG: hypothetical protein ACRD0K_22655 [Egibacteraceae bacterium]